MRKLKKIVHWSLLVIILIYLITGFGITYYQIVEKLTFGLLTKALAFQIHTNLAIIFLVVLFGHLYLTLKRK
jgi:thiosulfate reductase cytochrome b subunit